MNFKTVKQALYKKIKLMSEEDFNDFLTELKHVYFKAHYHNRKIKECNTEDLYYRVVKENNV